MKVFFIIHNENDNDNKERYCKLTYTNKYNRNNKGEEKVNPYNDITSAETFLLSAEQGLS